MIKANELRIGNYIYHLGIDYDQGENKVHDPEGDEVAEVLAIRPKIKGEYELLIDARSSDGNRRSASMVSMEGVSGIPLTPELLERCGFVYKDGATECGEERKNGVHLYVHDEDPGYFHYSRGSFNGTKIEIKYVHQLQNLYFALTGEEIIIKNYK